MIMHPETKRKDNKAEKAASQPVTGTQVVGGYLNALPGGPGVYRMINSAGDVLYVGKAKNLRKRVAAYTKPERLSRRIGKMVGETASMEFVTTHTEAEALLLEANLIKRLKPRFNILLRDDKSFPYILATRGHDFPRVLKHRGARSGNGEYFGPFASAWAVNETLAVLQRVFLLRTCSDAVFASRTRPCLQYQIKRCSAPCVGRVPKEDYSALMAQARAFLAGKSRNIQRAMAKRMEKASDELNFEEAAEYRDRIKALTRIQARQGINLAGVLNADVAAVHQSGGQTCIQVFFIRGGRNFGNRAYFPGHGKDDGAAEVLDAFLGQFYTNKPAPAEILISHDAPNRDLIAEALSVHAGRKVGVSRPRRGARRKLMDHALENARDALARRMSESASQRRLLEGLAHVLELDGVPARIEVYDNSHVSGAHAVGAMIVAGPEGMMKNAYRKFTIKGGDNSSPGDDYAMMGEVLTRRFSRALKEDPERTRGQWPDLVLIDGGKGHLGEARRVFEDLGLDGVALAAVSKGPDRNAGRELLHLPGKEGAIALKPRDPVLYFIQRLRDEAHRFAIGTHRAKRSKALTRSILDEIPGIGAKRKKALLHHFGSARAVADAGRGDLETVQGVSRATAKKIYDWFHAEG